jgi:hypothetical protein
MPPKLALMDLAPKQKHCMYPTRSNLHPGRVSSNVLIEASPVPADEYAKGDDARHLSERLHLLHPYFFEREEAIRRPAIRRRRQRGSDGSECGIRVSSTYLGVEPSLPAGTPRVCTGTRIRSSKLVVAILLRSRQPYLSPWGDN